MKEKGVLAVVSGFSGAGKGTIVSKLINNYDGYALSISATTRAPREGEVDGVHYFYKEYEEFEKMIEQDELYEYARYLDNYYGTPKAFVRDQIAAGKDVILEIDVQGALQIKKKYPGVLLVFVTPPSIDELSRRLRGRGTETEEQIHALKALGCDIVQGYFFSKPVPASEFEPFILQKKEAEIASRLSVAESRSSESDR